MIPSGLFARFGEVFEGFLPARRLHGDYYELNELGTALVGRRGGRRYRLGDEIEIRVEDIRKSEGKVEVRYFRERIRTRRRAKRPTIPAPTSAAREMTSCQGKSFVGGGL